MGIIIVIHVQLPANYLKPWINTSELVAIKSNLFKIWEDPINTLFEWKIFDVFSPNNLKRFSKQRWSRFHYSLYNWNDELHNIFKVKNVLFYFLELLCSFSWRNKEIYIHIYIPKGHTFLIQIIKNLEWYGTNITYDSILM